MQAIGALLVLGGFVVGFVAFIGVVLARVPFSKITGRLRWAKIYGVSLLALGAGTAISPAPKLTAKAVVKSSPKPQAFASKAPQKKQVAKPKPIVKKPRFTTITINSRTPNSTYKITDPSGRFVTSAKGARVSLKLPPGKYKIRTSANGFISSSTWTNGGTLTPRLARKPRPKPVVIPKPAPRVEPVQEVQSVYYANCTALRQDYPNGVSSDHPAYTSRMDRDGDGWACER
jgi:Excalibur calcium-binding domain